MSADSPTWLLDLALALTAAPDLRLEDPRCLDTFLHHAPCRWGRVWVHRGGEMVLVSSSGIDEKNEGSAVPPEPIDEHASSRIVDGAALFAVGPLAILELDVARLEKSDLEGIDRLVASIRSRLQASNLLESIVESLPDMVFVKDAEQLRFVHFNAAGEKLLGFTRDELIGRNDYDFFPKEEADFFTRNDRAVLESRRALDIPDESIRTADRGTRSLHTRKIPILGADGEPAYLLGISRDITERKQIDERLHQTQKLEAVAQLTAALAHNFNNAAMVISGYAELVQRELAVTEGRAGNYLGKLRRASGRVADLASRLLVFAQSRVLDSVVTNVSRLLAETAHIVEPLIGERIAIDIGGIERECYARVDRAQFEQVIVNLALNAKDAMPDGGTLALTLRRVDGRLELSVTDTGIGMSAEVASRAFDPFFTTKSSGQGSGLGLFSAAEIVQRHDGTITIEPADGGGTTVCIKLPSAPKPELEKSDDAPARSGNETILIVEDDTDVREVLAETLEARDYDVLTAPGGHEALALIEELDGEPIDLLLSDVVMPNMTGPELVVELRSRLPGTKVILVSGYTDEDEKLASDPDLIFLAKPVETDRLLEAVRQLLDAR